MLEASGATVCVEHNYEIETELYLLHITLKQHFALIMEAYFLCSSKELNERLRYNETSKPYS